jgi:hypothetical protein
MILNYGGTITRAPATDTGQCLAVLIEHDPLGLTILDDVPNLRTFKHIQVQQIPNGQARVIVTPIGRITLDTEIAPTLDVLYANAMDGFRVYIHDISPSS